MNFYSEISKYYDMIFPLSTTKLNFLKEYIKPNDNVVDLACGTGTYSLELAKIGIDILGLDLNEKMINLAILKANERNVNAKFKCYDMRDFDDLVANKLDTIFIIGNSLVHLKDENEIEKLIEKIYKNLNEGGNLIIQIINYDRILEKNINHLPTIKNDNIIFQRNYELNNDKILFKTKLYMNDGLGKKVLNNVSKLIPLRSKRLIDMLKNTGFNDVELFGSFNKEDFNSYESYALIVVANKY